MSSYHRLSHRPKWLGGTDPIPPFPPYHIKLFSDIQEVVAGDRWIFAIPFDMDGIHLMHAEIDVTTVGGSDLTVSVYNLTQAHEMLSTNAQIDSGDYHSADSATPVVVWGGHNQVFHKDRIRITINDDGSGAKGLAIILFFG